jgi:glutathione S-transferase
MITLYHYPSSPCAAKVRAVLTQKALPWDGRIVNIAEKENLRPEYLKHRAEVMRETRRPWDKIKQARAN